MAEHKYSQALRWIAEGEKVEIRWGSSPAWMQMSERNELVNDEVMRGCGEYEFRIKPRTLNIAGSEIEAPLQSAAHGSNAYAHSAAGGINHITFNTSNDEHADALANGRLFATPEAAKSAYDAITALLTGKDAA